MKVLCVGKDMPSSINKVRCFAAIEDFVIKDKPIVFLKEETEQKILDYMQELSFKRTIEEHNAIESAKKIILNA